MMKNVVITLLMLVTTLEGYSQAFLGNEWLVGVYGYKLNFDFSPPQHDTMHVSNFVYAHGNANICNANGNLILQTTSWDITNRNGVLIEDGDTLAYPLAYAFYNGANSGRQTSLFLPRENNQYLMINMLMNDTCFINNMSASSAPYNILNYNLVDMNANGGQGKVTQRMQPIMENVRMMKSGLTACRHGNGQDWWLITADLDSNNYYLTLVTNDSIVTDNVQRMPPYPRTFHDLGGQMVFSPDGSKFAQASSTSCCSVLLMDFDRCHGILSNFKRIEFPYDTMGNGQTDSLPVGVAFSPNGRFLYVNTYANIYQFDIQDSTWTKLGNWDSTYTYFCGYINSQLAPDGKIYIGRYHGVCKDYSVINNPDVKGIGCNFCKRCFTTQSSTGYVNTLPNMPNYALGAKTCWPLSQSESQEPRAEKWKVFPNPASMEVTLQWSSSPSVTTLITISDITGRVRKTVEVATGTNNVVIPLADLEYGVYVVELKQQGKTRFTEKLNVR